MSTVANTFEPLATEQRTRSIFLRFVWKEFRALRGLWLAVAALAILVQFAALLSFGRSEPDLPSVVFTAALAAAVLYAVGAAATIFAVEHEEETYDFLARLPVTWLPLFAAKILVTHTGALLLALALFITAWVFRGSRPLTSESLSANLGVLGIAIFEATAWGTLFSLLIRRPLLAAITTLVVGAIAVNIAVNISSSSISTEPQAYIDAIPLRLAIIAALLAASTWLARNWLSIPSPGAEGTGRGQGEGALASRITRRKSLQLAAEAPGSRCRLLNRLLWQTWRENWKLLLLPLPVGLLLIFAISGAASLLSIQSGNPELFLLLLPLTVPALYGAMTFYTDQRRDSYRFLAEHAAQPRYVWLARNIVWLGALAAATFIIVSIVAAVVGTIIWLAASDSLNQFIRWGASQYPSAASTEYELVHGAGAIFRFTCLATLGGLVAYGIGQFCSMKLRSEILAAFISMLLSTLVCAWVATLFVWQLSGWFFLLPLFAGTMLATWFRAPDWIAGRGWFSGRNWWRGWIKPLLAIALPIAMIAIFLPETRLRQLSNTWKLTDGGPRVITVDAAIAEELREFETPNAPEADAMAAMYIAAADRLNATPTPDLLARWRQPDLVVMPPDPTIDENGIDVTKIPIDELEAYNAAKKKTKAIISANDAAALEAVLKANEGPTSTCRFKFYFADARANQSHLYRNRRDVFLIADPLYQKLDYLIDRLCHDYSIETEGPWPLAESFNRYLSALRLSANIRNRQPVACFLDQLRKENEILGFLGQWATAANRKPDELQSAVKQLSAYFAIPPNPDGALLDARLATRDVINRKSESLWVSEWINNAWQNKTEFHLTKWTNDLSWERERGLRAVDRITLRNLDNTRELLGVINNRAPRQLGRTTLNRWLRPNNGGFPELWELEEPAATTSYFAVNEYKTRLSMSELYRAICDNQTHRRAALLRLGLALYRLENQNYPIRLADLVPKYLPEPPLDPYAGQEFAYEPAGLNLRVKWSNSQTVAANVPFFWSVGATNCRLRQTQFTEYVAADEGTTFDIDPPDEPEDWEGGARGGEAPVSGTPGESNAKTELAYTFEPAELGWWTSDNLVFPLPKQPLPKRKEELVGETVGGVSDAD